MRITLARQRERRGEPPAIGVELLAHLQARDTTVQPRALESYDQLREKHDASTVPLPKTENDALRARAEAPHLHGLLLGGAVVTRTPRSSTR